ncbi:MAG: hypothetical protein ACT4OX_03110 [Actinomycetota bacterium]
MSEHPEPTTGDPVAHFWRAAHELLMATRAVIDAADAVVEHQLERTASPPDASPRLRRIDVQ